jgi:hypothetical protein
MLLNSKTPDFPPSTNVTMRYRAASSVITITRQDKTMDFVKKQRWTEAEIAALPDGEHDYFDRKSGRMLSDPNFEKDLAKALCAFANSGGGHFILGVEDDGTFDGVPPIAPTPKSKSRQSTREWLEQKIPHLLNYPLQDYRVHEVEPDSDTAIPKDCVVIDVGDSALAPHQTANKYLSESPAPSPTSAVSMTFRSPMSPKPSSTAPSTANSGECESVFFGVDYWIPEEVPKTPPLAIPAPSGRRSLSPRRTLL